MRLASATIHYDIKDPGFLTAAEESPPFDRRMVRTYLYVLDSIIRNGLSKAFTQPKMELGGLQNSKASPEVENWDDGDFDNFDDIHFRSASTATSVISHPQTNHRESNSSRLSIRSDSNHGDEHWDVLVDEQSSLKDAVTVAKSKGIPLPSNLPRSALEGGTIRRLGGKAIKRAIADDWCEDIDFANSPQQLRLARAEERDLSESLRQISAAFHSSPKSPEEKNYLDTLKSPKARPAAPAPANLANFRDNDDDGDFGDVPTIRVAKHRSPQKVQLAASKLASTDGDVENVDEDLEIPADGKLRLSVRKFSPRTPLNTEDFDVDWGEGSLGTRHAGTRRGGMSNRSSSISALSPSVSSTFTAENDEDGLEGLVLPQGPVNFQDLLKRKQESEKENDVPKSASSPQLSRKTQTNEEDWTEDLVIPNGKVFDGAKLSSHRNVKHKNQRPSSPGKIKATTLNFTTAKTVSSMPRPRFGFGHERQERPRSHLEPVSETGAPIQRHPRPTSRLGHTANSSISSIPAPATPTPSTPSRRDLRNTVSRAEMRYQPATTTNAQLLRAKRSMPVIAGITSPTRTTFNRPPSRQDGLSSRLRHRSPERPESRLGSDKKSNAPFLPAGASTAQSQHISMKSASVRGLRRADSDGSSENMTAAQRSLSRLAAMRPQTPGKGRSDLTAAELAAQAKKTMNKPLRRRNWGDGSELEMFDDLPTSAAAEAKYTKQPIGRGAPRSTRGKIGQHGQATTSSTSLVSARSGAETPVQNTPLSPPKCQESALPNLHSKMPRFARDTAASRNAREQRSISTTFHNMRGEPLQPVATNAKATITSKPTYGSLRRNRSVQQQKPHLIKPLGGDLGRAKEEKGMYYNPVLCRWEGNDTALAPFDVPEFLPRQPSPGEGRHPNIKSGSTIGVNSPVTNATKPNMALIMNVGGSSGVQLVNGMVFDPRQMKWLKVAKGERGDSISRGTGSVQLEEEEDVFAGLEDLTEESENMSSMHEGPRERSTSGALDKLDPFTAEPAGLVDDEDAAHNSGLSGDEWGVAEEFDVGPDFVRRQRGEEERWKRKVEKWLRSEEEVAEAEAEGPAGWRWAIRDLVSARGHETG